MIGAVQGYTGVKLSKIGASESRMVNNPGSGFDVADRVFDTLHDAFRPLSENSDTGHIREDIAPPPCHRPRVRHVSAHGSSRDVSHRQNDEDLSAAAVFMNTEDVRLPSSAPFRLMSRWTRLASCPGYHRRPCPALPPT